MAEIKLDAKNIAIIIGLAIIAIYLANNVREIGNLVRPRGVVTS